MRAAVHDFASSMTMIISASRMVCRRWEITIVSTAFGDAAEIADDDGLAFRIERAGGFVEDDDARTAQQRAGDGEAAAFARRRD